MKNKHLFLALFALPLFAFAQTNQERERIASFSNKAGNEQLAKELKIEEEQRQARLAVYFAANPGVNKIIKDDENGKIEIMDVLPNGEMVYAKTDNAGAATTARATALYNGGSLGLNIQGQGMTVAIWDGGNVRDTHQEFMVGGVTKVINMDGVTMDSHPTHVAGTIVAQGIVSSVRGLAFNAGLKSYNWTGDISEMTSEASQGLLVSNHSYGIGSLGSLWFYGAYDSRARAIDLLCYNNPYYLPVVSAGNDRNETTPPGSTQIAQKYGYDMIFGHGNAKNVMTVAAVNNVSNYVNEGSVIMSSFSSYGPSDDGRIKPDISMKGVNVRSTMETSDSATGYMSGTSMASPGITGVVTLLQQYYNQLYSNFMRSATVKGLILHTADEAGEFPGPDYSFGWGLVNASKAARVIRDKNLTVNGSLIQEQSLSQGATYTKVITASGTEPLKISISWTDPAAPTSSINNGTVDPTTIYLVNDLDVKVVGADGTIYYPWKLGGMANAAFFDAATNASTNNVDNFERVDIPNPSGQYTITVSHKGTLLNGSQNFTLIASSSNLAALGTTEISSNVKKVTIYPNPTTDFVYFSNALDGSKVTILDMSGKIVQQEVIRESRVKTKDLKPGNYVLVYKGRDEVEASFKIIKK